MQPNGITVTPMTIYAVHAHAYFEVDTLGVKEFGLSISDDYSYDKTKHVITNYQNPPSASATANLGWYGSIADKNVHKYDSSAYDPLQMPIINILTHLAIMMVTSNCVLPQRVIIILMIRILAARLTDEGIRSLNRSGKFTFTNFSLLKFEC
jgi:hypothetical protein